MRLVITENISNGLASGSEVDWTPSVVAEMETQIGRARWEWSLPLAHVNRQRATWAPPPAREIEGNPTGDTLAEQVLQCLAGANFSGKENETHRRRLTSIAEAIEEKAKLQAEEKAHKESLSLVDPGVSDLEAQAARTSRIDALSRVRIDKALTEVLSAALSIETENCQETRWTPLAHETPPAPEPPDEDFAEPGELGADEIPPRPLRSMAEIHDLDQPRGVDEIRAELARLVQQLDEEALYFAGCPARSRQGLDYILRERLQAFRDFERVGCEFLDAIGAEHRDVQNIPRHPAIQRLFSWRLAQIEAQPVEVATNGR